MIRLIYLRNDPVPSYIVTFTVINIKLIVNKNNLLPTQHVFIIVIAIRSGTDVL